MIPWSLFEHKDVALLAVINFATGASFYSAIYFVGIFWTLVQNDKPGMAGLRILLYIPGIGKPARDTESYELRTKICVLTFRYWIVYGYVPM